MKFEGRSHEKTERQQRCARSKAWNLSKNIFKLKEKDKGLHSTFPWRSGKKGLNSAELETTRTSRSPTTVMTANGEVQTREEATVYVKQLDSCVTALLVKNHISSEMARELSALYPIMYHLWFLVYH